MARILVVEDCPDTRALIQRTLADHDTVGAGSHAEAQEALDERLPDLVVLDLGLPDGDGFALFERLRERPGAGRVPVLFLTASTATRDKVAAFAMGAEDYVEKPFDRAELRARVEARLRAARLRSERDEVLHLAPLRLDLGRMRVGVDGGAQDLGLTPHEFRLLHLLVQRVDRVVSRESIVDEAWGGVAVSPRTVDTHVSNLRRKLADARLAIEPVRGIGYRLVRGADPDATSSR